MGYLEELSGGSKEFVDGITETFLKNIPEQMEQMMDAYKANDLKSMGENAHRMKSSTFSASTRCTIPSDSSRPREKMR